MSARCRCWCGCERLDRELDDATSSWLVCMPCNLDRYRPEQVPVTVRRLPLVRLLDGKATDADRQYLSDKVWPVPDVYR